MKRQSTKNPARITWRVKLRPKKRGDDLRKIDALRTMTIEFKRIKP